MCQRILPGVKVDEVNITGDVTGTNTEYRLYKLQSLGN